MQITFRGQVTKQEYLRAIKLHFNRENRWRKPFFGVSIGILAIGAAIVVWNQTTSIDTLFPGLLIAIGFLTYPWWIPYLYLFSYNNQGNFYRGKIYGVINDAGVTIHGENSMFSHQWTAFSKAIGEADILMLYTGKNQMNLLTRSLFASQQDWDELVEALRDRKLLGS